MTDRSRGLAVVTAAGAMFFVALILLALQIRAGRDPAIGASAQAAAPRQVIVRRIIVRRIVEDDVPTARTTVARAARSAPAPAPAPAPAAPVVSRGS